MNADYFLGWVLGVNEGLKNGKRLRATTMVGWLVMVSVGFKNDGGRFLEGF